MVTSPLMTKELSFPYETNETNERKNTLSLYLSHSLSLSHTSIFFYDRLWSVDHIISFKIKKKCLVILLNRMILKPANQSPYLV
jgi:hypothetical protein